MAAWRANYNGAVLILGSATPSLESFYRAKTLKTTLLTLSERPLGATLPQVRIIDQRAAMGKRKLLSQELAASLKYSFSKNEQALLFINRRGYSSLPLCPSCGTVLKCPNCSVNLTLHGPSGAYGPYNNEDYEVLAGIPKGSVLICHGCGFRGAPVSKCPSCGEGVLRYQGTGTEKLLMQLERDYGMRGVKLDADSVRKKGGFKNILESFGNGDADFMVGTQMAAKGHDFPNLTTVGVVDADLGLNLPDFRAAERTHQLLSQVSGRAGRADKPGVVVIQTLNPDHYAIVAAAKHDFMTFYQKEIEIRKDLSLPPVGRLALLRFSGKQEEEVERLAEEAATMLSPLLLRLPKGEAEIMGPAPSPVEKLKERHRWQIMLRTDSVRARHAILKSFAAEFRK
jgi:primosomal protein N' (replication factor Y)